MNCHEAERLLDAYVDGELGPDDMASIAEHLETCAECRRRLEEREALGRLVRALPYYEVSPDLRTKVAGTRQSLRRSRVAPRMTALAAAAVLVLAVGSIVSFRAWWTTRSTSALADQIARRHVSAMAGQHLVDVPSSDQHTVKPWFQGKLDFSPIVVDLAPAGFPLVGGRLDSIDGRSVAALVYTRRLHVINLFIWPTDAGVTTIDTRTIRGFHERHWVQGGMSIWAVSDVNDDDLNEFVLRFEGK